MATRSVFFDEAQALSETTFDALPALLDLVREDGRPALQVVLAGQPELESRLAASGQALRSRVAVTARLGPLTPDEVAAYVRARLEHAKARDLDLFTPDALARVAALSGGIPRVINVLCEAALTSAFADGQHRIGRPTIDAVWADYAPLHAPQGTPMPRPPADALRIEPAAEEATPPATRSRTIALAAAGIAAASAIAILAIRPWHSPPPPAPVAPPTTLPAPPPPPAAPPPTVESAAPPETAPPTAKTVEQPPSASEALALVDRFWRAYEARDRDGVRALFAPEAIPTVDVLNVDPLGGGALVTPAPEVEAKPAGDRVTVRVPFQLNTHDDRGRPVRRQGVATWQIARRDGELRIVALEAESRPVPRR